MKLSVVIPSFNRPHFLERLLKSIAKQTCLPDEVIVVDDHSFNPERFNSLIEYYSQHLPQFRFLRNKTCKGAPYSRNRGIREASGELIALVDDDDEWLSHKLEKQIATFQKNPENLGLTYTWTNAIHLNQVVFKYRPVENGRPLANLLLSCFIPSPSVVVRKQAIIEAGLFDECFPSCQDWDMWTRILAKGYECQVVEEVLTLYHKHEKPSIGTSPKAQIGYSYYRKKHLFLYWEYHKKLFLKYALELFVTSKCKSKIKKSLNFLFAYDSTS